MEKTKKHLSRLPSKKTMDKLESTDIIIEMNLYKYQKAIKEAKSQARKETLEEVEKMIKNRIDIMEQLKKINEKSYQEVVLKELYFTMDKLKQLEKKER